MCQAPGLTLFVDHGDKYAYNTNASSLQGHPILTVVICHGNLIKKIMCVGNFCSVHYRSWRILHTGKIITFIKSGYFINRFIADILLFKFSVAFTMPCLVTGQLTDVPNRGLTTRGTVKSRTSQLVDRSTHRFHY